MVVLSFLCRAITYILHLLSSRPCFNPIPGRKHGVRFPFQSSSADSPCHSEGYELSGGHKDVIIDSRTE
jgi:hypothetical protein